VFDNLERMQPERPDFATRIASSEHARELAAKSAEARRRRALERRLAEAQRIVAEDYDGNPRDGLGDLSFAAARVVIHLVRSNLDKYVRHAGDAATIVKVLVMSGSSKPATRASTWRT
jgi:hypothetical protein